MSVQQEQNWITGAEFAAEWRRLVDEGIPENDPRFKDLFRRIGERDDYLFQRYGRPHVHRHPGKWIAISLAGEVLIRERPGEARHAADVAFGPGNAAIRKLGDPPYLEFYH